MKKNSSCSQSPKRGKKAQRGLMTIGIDLAAAGVNRRAVRPLHVGPLARRARHAALQLRHHVFTQTLTGGLCGVWLCSRSNRTR